MRVVNNDAVNGVPRQERQTHEGMAARRIEISFNLKRAIREVPIAQDVGAACVGKSAGLPKGYASIFTTGCRPTACMMMPPRIAQIRSNYTRSRRGLGLRYRIRNGWRANFTHADLGHGDGLRLHCSRSLARYTRHPPARARCVLIWRTL